MNHDGSPRDGGVARDKRDSRGVWTLSLPVLFPPRLARLA